MKDVAQRANVSLSTVSYVLNDSGPVASSRRARVLDAVRALNYIPNDAARSLKLGSAAAIGLVVPDLSNPFFSLVTEGVERATAERDVVVVLCAPAVTGRAETHYARLLESQRLDGIVYLCGAGATPDLAFELAHSGPVVLVDGCIPGFDLPAFVSDSRAGGRQVAECVLSQGHVRIAVIAGPVNLWTAEQRMAGYREAFAAFGLDPDTVPVIHGDYREESGFEAARALLNPADGRPPTALLCANDMMAIGAIRHCRTAGIVVPDDVSITGFDDVPLAAMIAPALTTVAQPADRMGYHAAAFVLDGLDGNVRPEPELMPVSLRVRDSVTSPPGDP